ncbi:MAG TPA: ATP-binding protein [Gemmatimonadales bacterium]|jgi:two-component system phosphate regulon sensor histidine kinase PhoR
MPRSLFFWKLFGGFMVVVLLGAVVTGRLTSRWLRADFEAATRDELTRQALLIRELALPALRSGDASALQAQLDRIAPGTDTRLTVIRDDGLVLAESEEDPATMDNHATRPEVVGARRTGRGSAVRFSRTIAANMMYVAVAVDDEGQRLGYARAGLSLAVFASRLDGLRDIIIMAGVAATFLALGAGFWIATRVTNRLATLTRAAERIARGEEGVRVPTGPTERDELGRLAGSFSTMARALDERLAMIEEDRRKLRAILGGMAEGVVAVDAQQRILHLNATAGDLLGAEAAAGTGKFLWQVSRAQGVSEAIETTIDEDAKVRREVELEANGQRRTIEVLGSPLRGARGETVGAVAVLHDLTDLRRLETVRRDFVANVSHEIKTPITAIRGLIETVVGDVEMPEDTRRRFLGRIQNQALRLSLLVSDLLTLARLESVGGRPEFEPLDLRATVGQSVEPYRLDAAERGVTLSVEVPADPVPVDGDPEALGLVVNNLIDNALKYTAAGGSVSVVLRLVEGSAEIAVRDTGVGIAREHHDRVFERFYRVDKARSRELGGTGLGLSIVKHVCRTHGGSVYLDSAPGSGSVFTVSLPTAVVPV